MAINWDMVIRPGTKLKVSFDTNDDGTNNGSIFWEKYPGHAYCIAKAPKYATDAEWDLNASYIVALIENARPE